MESVSSEDSPLTTSWTPPPSSSSSSSTLFRRVVLLIGLLLCSCNTVSSSSSSSSSSSLSSGSEEGQKHPLSVHHMKSVYSNVFIVSASFNKKTASWFSLGRYYQSPQHKRDCRIRNGLAFNNSARNKLMLLEGFYSPPVALAVPSSFRSSHIGEPKIVYWKDKVFAYGYTNGKLSNKDQLVNTMMNNWEKTRMEKYFESSYLNYLLEFSYGSLLRGVTVPLSYMDLNGTNKNFLLYQSSETALSALVDVSPHLKYDIDLSNGFMERKQMWNGSLGFIDASRKCLSGGPIQLDDGNLLVAGHNAIGTWYEAIRKAFFYVFDKESGEIRCVTPIVRLGFHDKIEYITHMERLGDWLWFSAGVNSCYSVVFKIKLRDILGICSALSAPKVSELSAENNGPFPTVFLNFRHTEGASLITSVLRSGMYRVWRTDSVDNFQSTRKMKKNKRVKLEDWGHKTQKDFSTLLKKSMQNDFNFLTVERNLVKSFSGLSSLAEWVTILRAPYERFLTDYFQDYHQVNRGQSLHEFAMSNISHHGFNVTYNKGNYYVRMLNGWGTSPLTVLDDSHLNYAKTVLMKFSVVAILSNNVSITALQNRLGIGDVEISESLGNNAIGVDDVEAFRSTFEKENSLDIALFDWAKAYFW